VVVAIVAAEVGVRQHGIWVVGVESLKVLEHLIAHIGDQLAVLPDLIEPLLEVAAVAAAVDDQIKLNSAAVSRGLRAEL
jgi:hypothetical protein